MSDERAHHEQLVEKLMSDPMREAYRAQYSAYRPRLVPQLIAGVCIWSGNVLYGYAPSYQKFRAIEVIARIPYHSWSAAAFTLLTLFYSNEKRALRLSHNARFAEFASENETMHVVVISQLARAHEKTKFFRHVIIPSLFAFFYFWASYLIYLLNSRWALEINYIFESHAFEQYSLFLERHKSELEHCPIESDYLTWYGRQSRSEYEFFQAVRNDELVHRVRSIEEIVLFRSPNAVLQ